MKTNPQHLPCMAVFLQDISFLNSAGHTALASEKISLMMSKKNFVSTLLIPQLDFRAITIIRQIENLYFIHNVLSTLYIDDHRLVGC